MHSMLSKIVFLFFCLFVFQAFASPKEIQRSDGSMIRFYLEKPTSLAFPIIIVVQGSECISTWPLVQMVKSVVGDRAAVLGIEKYGLNERTTTCPQSYIDNNTVDGRIQDHLEVLAYLRTHENKWSKSLVWAGGSEGGQIAALSAPLAPETKLIVMLAAGGGLTMAEELPIITTKRLKKLGSSSEEISKSVDNLYFRYQQIKDNPTSKIEWLSDGKLARNTYKWWNSILWKKALPLLEKVQTPIYIAHGAEDTSCPVESSQAIIERFQVLGKTNLTAKMYSGLEHSWIDSSGVDHTPQVLNDAFNWIYQNLN